MTQDIHNMRLVLPAKHTGPEIRATSGEQHFFLGQTNCGHFEHRGFWLAVLCQMSFLVPSWRHGDMDRDIPDKSSFVPHGATGRDHLEPENHAMIIRQERYQDVNN